MHLCNNFIATRSSRCGDSKARSYYCSIHLFDDIVCLVTVNPVLHPLSKLSVRFPSREVARSSGGSQGMLCWNWGDSDDAEWEARHGKGVEVRRTRMLTQPFLFQRLPHQLILKPASLWRVLIWVRKQTSYLMACRVSVIRTKCICQHQNLNTADTAWNTNVQLINQSTNLEFKSRIMFPHSFWQKIALPSITLPATIGDHQ